MILRLRVPICLRLKEDEGRAYHRDYFCEGARPLHRDLLLQHMVAVVVGALFNILEVYAIELADLEVALLQRHGKELPLMSAALDFLYFVTPLVLSLAGCGARGIVYISKKVLYLALVLVQKV